MTPRQTLTATDRRLIKEMLRAELLPLEKRLAAVEKLLRMLGKKTEELRVYRFVDMPIRTLNEQEAKALNETTKRMMKEKPTLPGRL